MPTIETGVGNCHTYVHARRILEMAVDIAFNAKVQRPGAGNSMETLLVDRAVAEEFLPLVAPRLAAAGVELRGCPVPGGSSAVSAQRPSRTGTGITWRRSWRSEW